MSYAEPEVNVALVVWSVTSAILFAYGRTGCFDMLGSAVPHLSVTQFGFWFEMPLVAKSGYRSMRLWLVNSFAVASPNRQ
jgi:hypothetical protein